MPPTRTRVSVRKKSTIKYGRKITRLHVGRTKEIFPIHEDLLCANSPFFKKKLQEKRKPVEGDCPICSAELEPNRREITYCSSVCGGNMHRDCMQKWQDEKIAKREEVTCPMCRAVWVKHKDEQICRVPEISEESFATYSQWIYDRKISVPEAEVKGDMGPGYFMMLQAYLLGVKVEDRHFRKAILESLLELFQETLQYPDVRFVTQAYAATDKPDPMRSFLVGIHLTVGDASWFGDEDHYPSGFMKDLIVALLMKNPGTFDWDFDDVMSKYVTDDEGGDSESASTASSSGPQTRSVLPATLPSSTSGLQQAIISNIDSTDLRSLRLHLP